MAFMVKNPGLIPKMESLREGEVQKKQAMQAIMLEGCWKSCIDDDPVTKEPFFADAIIANPPSFAHIHCAQALSIPVHLMFTMPWSSTRAFPHPLANLRSASMDPRAANWVSYKMVEWLIWQGFGDLINKWRRSIGLSALSSTQGPCLAETLKVPFTYCWSPTLIPKPRDWSDNIGMSFQSLCQVYQDAHYNRYLRVLFQRYSFIFPSHRIKRLFTTRLTTCIHWVWQYCCGRSSETHRYYPHIHIESRNSGDCVKGLE